MRHAIVTETWPPEVNGVALTVRQLAEGLQARGHAVQVVRPRQPGDDDCDGDASAPDRLLVRGLPLPRYPGLRFGLPSTGALARAWRAAPPDAVYVATEGPLGWSALRVARRLGIPAATGLHTRFDRYMRDYALPVLEPVALHWLRRFHNHADATLVPTAELARFLRGAGFRNVRLLARAVDTTCFDPRHRDPGLRREWGLDADAPAVLHVGRIAAEKNLELAVRAFRALQARRPAARMVWVGDGPERARLQRENPDFVFAGLRRGRDLARHYASADLFCFPSHSETFGNVTLEALASGVPVVAFDTGAAREHLRDGVDGAAVALGDDRGFVDAVVRIGADDLLRGAMRMAARSAVSGLRPQRVAADFEAILAQLALGRGLHGSVAAA
jgi:glycosyltransferase involved in cell wall biosynthesis